MHRNLLFACSILPSLLFAQSQAEIDITHVPEGDIISDDFDEANVDSRMENSSSYFQEMGIGREESVSKAEALKIYLATLVDSLNDGDTQKRWAEYFQLSSEQTRLAVQMFSQYVSSYKSLEAQQFAEACNVFFELESSNSIAAHSEAFQLIDGEPAPAEMLRNSFHSDLQNAFGENFSQRFTEVITTAERSIFLLKADAAALNQAAGISDSDFFNRACK